VPARGGESEILFPTLDRALLTSEIGAFTYEGKVRKGNTL